MYKIPKYEKTSMKLDNTKPGETIEDKVTRLIQNKEPIKDGAPIIFTDRAHGVNPAYNIRTDRWEIAVDAMEKVAKMKAAKKEDVAKGPDVDGKVVKGDFGKTESVHGKTSEN
ncbi:MAG: hypothetical protein [Microviridae sp.]|nr:MAG: hypothetical protein [Microviridae sp.]